ncbi:hypothetical protein PWT90_07163 [Aphanocladium album]|nr:hypothetical protein PWT90_07163 [Aphanocladium album]
MDSDGINCACSIARLLDAASSILATEPVRGDELPTALASPSLATTNALVQQLRSDVDSAAPIAPEAILTDFDQLMIVTKQDCAALAEKCDALTQHRTSVQTQPLHELVNRIRDSLNNGIARHHWIGMSQAIKQVASTNVRFGASETEKIDEIARDVDGLFTAILGLSTAVPHANNQDRGSKNPRSIDSFSTAMLAHWAQIYSRSMQIEELFEQQTILSALHYWTMDNRKALIPKEHENTFAWILDPKSNFSTWLTSRGPLFWISGKPGSGKSTALKYIAENQNTIILLENWASNDRLITAEFYFWSSAANELQKSGQGLLRSILLQIIRQCPELGPVAFPTRSVAPRKWEPSLEELQCGFTRLLARLPAVNTKICLFIDGLDEFYGHPEDAIRLLQGISADNNSVKICVSSRPWVEFEDAFGRGDCSKLYMHELTKDDMRKYVQDLLSLKGADSESLVENIVEKAEGVFLWAFLVLRDTGPLAGEELYDEIDKLHSNLEDYLETKICRTAPERREATAKIFRIAIAAVGKLPLRQYSLIHSPGLDSIGAEWADRELHLVSGNSPSVAKLEMDLDSLSCGLLRPTSNSPQYVEFIHRTVADFLQSEKMTDLFEGWYEFEVDQAICFSTLAVLRWWPPTLPQDESRLLNALHVFMAHACFLSGNVQSLLLGQLWNWLEQLQKELPNAAVMMTVLGPGNFWAYDASLRFAFLYYCMSYGLGQYVSHQLAATHQPGFCEPVAALLSGSLSWDPRVRASVPPAPTKAIEPLLKMGLDCNTQWGDRNITFWQQLVVSSYSKYLKGILTREDCVAMELALAHGADPSTTVEVFAKGMNKLSAEEIIRIIC